MMYKKTEKMKTEKMTYEKPTVQKVEFDYKTRIAASGCALDPGSFEKKLLCMIG